METQKTYYITTMYGKTEVDENTYREYKRPEYREQKYLERRKRCRAGESKRCKDDCSKCPHVRAGTPVSLDVLISEGQEPAAYGADPADSFEKKAVYDALYAAIDQLPPRDGKIVRMLKLQGMTERAVAAEVGLTQKGVNYAYHRAQAQLRELMKNWR